MGTQDSVAIPLLIIVFLGMAALGIRSWYRLKQNKPLFPNAKRHFAGFVFAILLIAAFGISIHEIPFLVIVLLGMPALGITSWYRLKRGKPFPPKRKQYSGVITLLAMLWLLSAVVASRKRIVLFPSNLPTAGEWFVGGIFVVAILARVYLGWRRLKADKKRVLLRILPENRGELCIWAVVSLMAGVAEECAYRGVAYSLLWQMTGSVAAALTICIVAFGISHAAQGWKSALSVGLLGLIFHIAVLLTGTLYLAIGMHAVYDFVLGLLVMRLLNRDRMEAVQITQPASLAQD